MTEDDLRKSFLDELTKIAPDLDASGIGNDDDLQEVLELDSMDILNLVSALHQRLDVEIPEADYVQIATLAKAVRYLSQRLGL